ncbi:AraC family transcriptional regulator [Paenibacillus radicis (ex Xue et al. 2023)]|uniref:AraC family transcriptional regulator n=1 Tax=Paenibacillus radicis (ex Xue et al. 2023) TaxID=2972489 RepID=A0ABT1YPI5_9BACL|nr:AraC family transcriptional regulator [Paenibacillus radicis (ex Xue et al. 2023)]MCR8635094.1 AraC family transcriptional regulator [Paenibacillus radicis (ex Xue et al. 2023)]
MSVQSSAHMQRTLYLLSSIRKFKRLDTFTIQRRTVPVPMLCFIAKGKGTLTVNDATYSVEPLQLFYFAPGMTLEAASRGKELEYYLIIIETVAAAKRNNHWKLQSSIGLLHSLPAGRLYIQDAKQLLQRIDELYTTVNNRTVSNLIDPDLQLQSLIDLIARGIRQEPSDGTQSNGIDSCITYMHQHFHEKITRETLAEIAKLTPNAFCRSFKRQTGSNPTDYLNTIRINQAKSRLTPDCSIKDVAVTIGYGSEYYFSRIFKESVGISPSLFIKRERLKVAAASRTCFHDNLASIGMPAAAGVDCYRYPWMDDAEYNRRLTSQLEQLRLVKPDLIIGDYFHQPLYESLKQIAPTVILDHHLDWRTIHMKIAELVGREKEAFQTFHQLDERTLEARNQLSKAMGNERITFLQIIPQGIRIQGAANHPLNELLYSELGLHPGSAVPPNKMRDELLPEQFPPMESEHLFISKYIGHPDVEAVLSKLQQTPSWKTIHAVTDNKTYFTPNWLQTSWTPLGRNQIITTMVNLLLR